MTAFRKEITGLLGEKGAERVFAARIGIAGAGGIGSNCAVNLVRSGFRNMIIVDFDAVETSNLTRQFFFADQVSRKKTAALEENLKRINPDLDLQCVEKKLTFPFGPEFFADRDVVIEALDRPDEKSLFVSEMASRGKFVVAVSGIAGYGASDDIRISRPMRNVVIVGDGVSDAVRIKPFSPKVNVAAAKQADIVLEYVLTGKVTPAGGHFSAR